MRTMRHEFLLTSLFARNSFDLAQNIFRSSVQFIERIDKHLDRIYSRFIEVCSIVNETVQKEKKISKKRLRNATRTAAINIRFSRTFTNW